jgi:hypothetical protein
MYLLCIRVCVAGNTIIGTQTKQTTHDGVCAVNWKPVFSNLICSIGVSQLDKPPSPILVTILLWAVGL